MRRVIDIAPQRAAAGDAGFLFGIDAHVAHRGKIDHQSAVADAEAAGVMTPAANRNDQLVVACEIYRSNDVSHVGAARDQFWTAIDHAVVDLASLVVTRIARGNEAASQAGFQRGNGGISHETPPAYKCIPAPSGPVLI